MEEVLVVMENITFKRVTVLPQSGRVKFLINISKISGNFEIFEGGSVVAYGIIRPSKNISSEFTFAEEPKLPPNHYLPLNREEVYKEC